MKSFEEVMELTRTVSSATALHDEEARALYEACAEVTCGMIVEVGCQLGRSSSVIAQMTPLSFYSIHIDPFTEQPDYLAQWHRMMWGIGGRDHNPYIHFCMRTDEAVGLLSAYRFNLAYVDGDHEYPGVMTDLNILCPLINPGGLLLMHDYGRDSLPGVFKAATEFLSPDEWEQIGVAGTMSTWRKR